MIQQDDISNDVKLIDQQTNDAAQVKATHNDTRHKEVEFLLRSDVQMKIQAPT